MKQCPECLGMFASPVKRQVYCSDTCRTIAMKSRQSASRPRSKKRKTCASSKCNNLVSIYSDSIYCSLCYLADSTIEKDLRKIRRFSGA